MTLKELNKRNTPIVLIDKSLEQFKGKILFPEKLAKANEVLRKIGLPNKESKINSLSKSVSIILISVFSFSKFLFT